jgi:DNA-binding transcriptional MocR family regulator
MVEVPDNPAARAVPEGKVNLVNSHCVDVGQGAEVQNYLAEVVREESVIHTDYVRDEAIKSCRDMAAMWMMECGIPAPRSDVVLTHGAHSSVLVSLLSVLQGKDPAVLTAAECYPGFRQTASLCRARFIPVPSDDEGLLPDAIDVLARQHGAQAILMSSYAQNPTCVSTSEPRRKEIAELARKLDLQIVEDDVYGVVSANPGTRLCEYVPERVWHATSLSKCFAPGIRMGFLRTPPGQGGLGIRVMQGLSLAHNGIITRLVERLFEDRIVQKYAPRVARENNNRVEVAKRVFSNWKLGTQESVQIVWLSLPDNWHLSAFSRRCEEEGVVVSPADIFVVPGGQTPNAVRLSLSGAEDLAHLERGLMRLDRILSENQKATLI